MANIKFSTGRSLLDVKAETWVTQEERKEQLRMAKCRVQVPKEPVEMPEVPKSFGKVAVVSPVEQCPPKKRGRKPKTEVEETKSTAKTGKANKRQNEAWSWFGIGFGYMIFCIIYLSRTYIYSDFKKNWPGEGKGRTTKKTIKV